VVSGETDPQWNAGVMGGADTLLSFRHNIEQTSNNDAFFIVRLVQAKTVHKVFRLNRESIRGLWASQQQELLYFRNIDAERGSIQNAKCVLRNIANQSCDQPVGYPIYISEIDHSFTTTWSGHGLFRRLRAGIVSAGSWFGLRGKEPSAAPGRVTSRSHLTDPITNAAYRESALADTENDFEEVELVEFGRTVGSPHEASVSKSAVTADVVVDVAAFGALQI